MKVAIYIRVSSRDSQDPKNQLRQLRAFCAAQSWTIVREYEDRLSGKHSDRDDFQQMFDAASRRQFDAVLFWGIEDSAGRSVRDLTAPSAANILRRWFSLLHRTVFGFLRYVSRCRHRNPCRHCQAGKSEDQPANDCRTRTRSRTGASWWASATGMRQKQSLQAACCRTNPRRNRQRTGRQQDLDSSHHSAILTKGEPVIRTLLRHLLVDFLILVALLTASVVLPVATPSAGAQSHWSAGRLLALAVGRGGLVVSACASWSSRGSGAGGNPWRNGRLAKAAGSGGMPKARRGCSALCYSATPLNSPSSCWFHPARSPCTCFRLRHGRRWHSRSFGAQRRG